MPEKRKISVVGLGYVGLPVAAAFARAGFSVTGQGSELGLTALSLLHKP